MPIAILCNHAASALGAEPPADDHWLSRLVGHWVLAGRIAGKETTHDVDGEWVLNHLYVRIHEVSREKDPKGQPAYEQSCTSRQVSRRGSIHVAGQYREWGIG
jgi:hypothetical protein